MSVFHDIFNHHLFLLPPIMSNPHLYLLLALRCENVMMFHPPLDFYCSTIIIFLLKRPGVILNIIFPSRNLTPLLVFCGCHFFPRYSLDFVSFSWSSNSTLHSSILIPPTPLIITFSATVVFIGFLAIMIGSKAGFNAVP